MAVERDPIIGNWYRRLDKGQMFKVVGLDEQRGLVEIQHFDGDLEETDLGDWGDMELEAIAEPEDWTGPVDDVEVDDTDYSETDMSAADWRRSVEENVGPSQEAWEDEQPEDERDEWAEGDATEELYDPSVPSDEQAPGSPEEESRESEGPDETPR
jgi:hypothetical protein